MWFTENPWPPMLVTVIAALMFFGIWNNDRRNVYFFLALAFLGMTGGIYAVERAIVTEGERLQNDVALMCEQFRKRDPRTLDHFSELAPEWKDVCKTAMAMVEVRDDLRLTDFETSFSDKNSWAKVHFRANGTISAMGATAHHPFRCVLTFQKEGDFWKIIEVERLDPLNGEKLEILEHR